MNPKRKFRHPLRMLTGTKKVASDFSIYGIVDSIDMRGARTYDKAKEIVACSWQK